MNTNMNMNGRRKRRSNSKSIELNSIKESFNNSTISTPAEIFMGDPMEPFLNEINDEMLKNLYNSFQHCQNDFGKMDFKCEEEIIVTSWNFMKNSIKKNEFCRINEINVENPIRSF